MIPDPQCVHCKNLVDNKCPAYAKIPLDIWLNVHDHRKPFKGDHGIRFRAKKGKRGWKIRGEK